MITILYNIVGILSGASTLMVIGMWVLYVCLVSGITKFIYRDTPKEVPGFVAAVFGTILGNIVNWILGLNASVFALSGIILAVLGTVLYIQIHNSIHAHD
jgi:hypothetical protein